MATGFINLYEREILDYFFSGAAMTAAPGTWYVALYTTIPADTGSGGVEPSTGSYARVAVTNNATEFPAAGGATPSTKTNANTITFPTATGTWGDIIGFGMFGGASGGTPWFFGALSATVNIVSTDVFTIAAGDLHIELGDPTDTYSS